MTKKKGFTLVELVAVLVIMAIIALIATPLILNLINKAKASANKRSVDAYGKAVEISVLTYLMDSGSYPTDLTTLSVEYSGKEVTCNVMNLNTDGSIYLSECSVGTTEVKDTNNEDGWYHYGKYEGTGSSEDGSGGANDDSNQTATAVDTLLSKANDASVTIYDAGTDATHEMYTFTQDATVQTEALTDYRYIGSDPYNYVTFNDEEWRIIGVFTVEDENGEKAQRIKIIRNESIGNYVWDSDAENEWTTASLNTYLNGDYYNSLSSEAQSMIAPAKFYLGGIYGNLGHGASDYYTFERGETVISGNSTNWIGNIGIMYPSDYVYSYSYGVDNTCYTDGFSCDTYSGGNPSSGWLYNGDYQWTISPYAVGADIAFSVSSPGYVDSGFDVGSDYGVRSSIYLKSDIQIVEGNGSQEAPYQLKLN